MYRSPLFLELSGWEAPCASDSRFSGPTMEQYPKYNLRIDEADGSIYAVSIHLSTIPRGMLEFFVQGSWKKLTRNAGWI